MPRGFYDPELRFKGTERSHLDWLKGHVRGIEILEEKEGYYIYYKPYSKTVEKLTKRDGNIYVCIRKPDQDHFDELKWVEYSDKEWPKMKTVPQHIKDKAQAFRDFYTLKAKVTSRP